MRTNRRTKTIADDPTDRAHPATPRRPARSGLCHLDEGGLAADRERQLDHRPDHARPHLPEPRQCRRGFGVYGVDVYPVVAVQHPLLHRRVRRHIRLAILGGRPAAAGRGGRLARPLLRGRRRAVAPPDDPLHGRHLCPGRPLAARPGTRVRVLPVHVLVRGAGRDRGRPQRVLFGPRREPDGRAVEWRRARGERRPRLRADLREVRVPGDGHRGRRLGDGRRGVGRGPRRPRALPPAEVPGRIRDADRLAVRAGPVRPVPALRDPERAPVDAGHHRVQRVHHHVRLVRGRRTGRDRTGDHDQPRVVHPDVRPRPGGRDPGRHQPGAQRYGDGREGRASSASRWR